MSKPNLHIVEPVTATKSPVEPEAALRRLFARERNLEAELAKVRASLAFERKRYAGKHRFVVFPSTDNLRRLFG